MATQAPATWVHAQPLAPQHDIASSAQDDRSIIVIDAPMTWSQVAEVASDHARLALAPAAAARIDHGADIVQAVIEHGLRAYGLNTGVGALAEVLVPRDEGRRLSSNILMSHAVGVGPPLGEAETRAIMAVTVNNFAHGHAGVRCEVVERIIDLLNADCWPEAPGQGSVGYLSHRAHIGLTLIGQGHVRLGGERLPAAEALARLNLAPLVLEAKEGLSLVNGTACAAGLACRVLAEAGRLMDWADAVAAMSFEVLGCQVDSLAPASMGLRTSPGLSQVATALSARLAGSELLTQAKGRRTQDALSLRGIPQVHGAARDAWADVATVVDRELASFTDNPAVLGTPLAPQVFSQAHAMGPALGLAMDQIGVTMAQLAMAAERRLDRMVNPLVSGLPPFLAADGGVASGFMIAQYTAVSLVAENRRLAAPASLDGGVTSGLQEDLLCHATPAALKALEILVNAKVIVALELLAACQGYDFLDAVRAAPATAAVYRALRRDIPHYADDRPFSDDIALAVDFIARGPPEAIMDRGDPG